MACNCAKSRKTKQAEQQAAAKQQIDSTTQKPVASSSTMATPTQSTTQSFALQVGGRKIKTFGSRLEADAENVRRGYPGRVVAL